MSIFEYDQEAHMKLVRQEGIVAGIAESILELLAGIGDVPTELQDRISSQTDSQQLKKWLKLAAKAESLEEFVAGM